MLCVPVLVRNKLIGVLQALNKQQDTFNKMDCRVLISLAGQIGVALDNARLYHALNDTFHAVIQVLIDAIEKRDPYASGHAKRVSMYSVAIGRELGLDKGQLVNLKLAALLHDVGMMSMSDDMLHNRGTGKLKEKQVVKKHLELGTELLASVKPLSHLLPIIKYHHEQYDGSGPYRLAGEKIPLLARIIVIADSLDSMLNDRPYGMCGLRCRPAGTGTRRRSQIRSKNSQTVRTQQIHQTRPPFLQLLICYTADNLRDRQWHEQSHQATSRYFRPPSPG